MTSWSHGYTAEVPYTFGYYRETSPLWIKWAVFLGGKIPPSDKKLKVLELGCGQGFNLCVHASCFPEIEFLGIDFDPSHISHAKELSEKAGLKNIRFEEGDFVELAHNWPKEYGKFHIVILHGIWSWISKDIRQKVVEILKRIVLPGGLVYNSYNAMPGWMSGTILRELLKNYHKISNLPVLQAIEKGLQLAKRLQEMNLLVFRVYPNLRNRIEAALKHNKNYVVHEYLHEAHDIFWVHEVIDEMKEAKLSYIASSTLIDNFYPALFPDPVENMVRGFSHPEFRLFLIDLIINQSFRRDIYQKGSFHFSGFEHIKKMKEMRFMKIKDPEGEEKEFKFQTPAGVLQGKREVYEPILSALDKEPKSFGELLEIKELKEQDAKIPKLTQALSILIDKEIVSFYNPGYDLSYTSQFNKTIIELCLEGRQYNFLAAPFTTVGVSVVPVEMFVLNAIFNGIKSIDKITEDVDLRLNILGRSLIKDGKVIEDQEERRRFLQEQIQNFAIKKLPILKRCGVVV